MIGEGIAHSMGVERVHIAALIARLEGPDKENSIRAGLDLGQMFREDAEQLGDSILEVYLTSGGSAGTWSRKENITKFVKKIQLPGNTVREIEAFCAVTTRGQPEKRALRATP